MTDSFEVSVARYREFLRSCEYPSEIRWIDSYSLLFSTKNRKAYVNVRSSPTLTELANARYDEGMRRGLGVLFRAICATKNEACCYVWIPKDREEAIGHLMPASGELKMSVVVGDSRIFAVPVRNQFYWKLLKLLGNKPWPTELDL